MMVERLFLAVPWGCLRFTIVVFPDQTHYFLFTVESLFCFISLLYLYLYVLGDDALIS